MAVSPEYRAYVEDLVADLGPVVTRRMFGGLGVFYRGLMFILVARENVYMKVDDRNRPEFEAAGSDPFTYQRNGKPRQMRSYYRVPDTVLDDPETFLEWARWSVDAALRADANKPKKSH
jgi:DNA transformation protein